MEPREKIIVALDVDSVQKATVLVRQLAPYVGAFKIGLEFINSMLASLIVEEISVATQRLFEIRTLFMLLDGKVFWDGKFKDIPATIAGATKAVARINIKMFNVHCFGGPAMMKKAREVADEVAKSQSGHRPLILGVTLLTSLDYQDLVEMRLMENLNIADPKELADIKGGRIKSLVQNLARLAQENGLDGAIASPQEIQAIREYCQPEFLVITPGVRPLWAATGDQKRVMTPGEAIKAGASYLVIGRPITQPPAEIGGPVEAAKRIAEEIGTAL